MGEGARGERRSAGHSWQMGQGRAIAQGLGSRAQDARARRGADGAVAQSLGPRGQLCQGLLRVERRRPHSSLLNRLGLLN